MHQEVHHFYCCLGLAVSTVQEETGETEDPNRSATRSKSEGTSGSEVAEHNREGGIVHSGSQEIRLPEPESRFVALIGCGRHTYDKFDFVE